MTKIFTFLMLFFLPFTFWAQPSLRTMPVHKLLTKEAGEWNIAQTIDFFEDNIEPEFNARKAKILSKNPGGYYFLKLKTEMQKKNPDTIQAYLYCRVITHLDSLNYHYKKDKKIDKKRNKRNRVQLHQKTIVKEASDYAELFENHFYEQKRRLGDTVKVLNQNMRLLQEELKKQQAWLDMLDVERDSLITIQLDKVKKESAQTNTNIERMKSQGAEITLNGSAALAIKIRPRINSPRVKIGSSHFNLGEECDDLTNDYAEEIVQVLIEQANQIPDKSVVTLKANITGMADGHGYQKSIAKYSGTLGNILSLQYSYKAIQYGFTDNPSAVAAETKNLWLDVNTFYDNGELGAMRAYCFFKTLKQKLGAFGIEVKEEDCSFNAHEFQVKSGEKRGIYADLTIENLFKHNTDRIHALEDSIRLGSERVRKIKVKVKNAKKQIEKLEDIIARYFIQDGTELLRLIDEINAYASKKNRKPFLKTTKPTLYLMLCADTYDLSLGIGALRTSRQLHQLFEQIAKYAGLELKLLNYSGSRFTKNQVETGINALRTNPEDVVVFYFFGHGFRQTAQESPFSQLFIGNKSTQTKKNAAQQSLPLEWIHKKLIGQKARLTLVVGEACNVPEQNKGQAIFVKADKVQEADASMKFHPKKTTDLFTKAKANILIASSRPNQQSWTTNEGGFFAKQFVANFCDWLSPLNPKTGNWELVLEQLVHDVRRSASGKGVEQTPIFLVK